MYWFYFIDKILDLVVWVFTEIDLFLNLLIIYVISTRRRNFAQAILNVTSMIKTLSDLVD